MHGVSSGLRLALEHMLGEMAKQGAERNAQGRKLRSGVEALLAQEAKVEGASNTLPLFKPKQDDWGVAVMRSSRPCRRRRKGRSARC